MSTKASSPERGQSFDAPSRSAGQGGGDNFDRTSLYGDLGTISGTRGVDSGNFKLNDVKLNSDVALNPGQGNPTDSGMLGNFQRNDGKLPQFVSTDQTNLYGAFASASGNDKVTPGADSKVLPPEDQEKRKSIGQKVNDDVYKGAENYGFNQAHDQRQENKFKDDLKLLTEQAYRAKGEQGLSDVAGKMNDDGLDKFGEGAFKNAPGKFNDSLVKVGVAPAKDGGTWVKWDFAQPYGNGEKSLEVHIPKRGEMPTEPHVFTGHYQS